MNKKKVLRIVQLYELYWLTRTKRKFYKPQDRNLANMWVRNMKKELEIKWVNKIWSSDFTHIYYKWIRLFLATIIDDFTKKIVWYSIWNFHSKELILKALENALKNNKVPLILHSDQWSEYRSYEYFETLRRYNISASMSKKSSPWENWWQESFYWKLKFELWNLNRFNNIWEVIEAIHLHIHYYNNYRIHTAIKTSPINFEFLHS